jgi:hypothetical protein
MFALAQPGPSEQETLDAIGRAFLEASRREGGPILAVAGAIVVLALLGWALRRALRETRRDAMEQAVADERHHAALVEADTREHQDWVHVPVRLRLTLQHTDMHGRTTFEECETQDVSGGWVTFLTHARPPDGLPVAFTLHLDEQWPLRLHGVVDHVEAPAVQGGALRVAVKLGPLPAAIEEHLVRWVTREELRAIDESRSGRRCAACGRPLADDARERHSACAELLAPAASAVEPRASRSSAPVGSKRPSGMPQRTGHGRATTH